MAYHVRVRPSALIMDQDSILMIEYRDEQGLHYNLPGGGAEPGETMIDAVKREVFEETLADIVVGELAFAYEFAPHHQSGEYRSDIHTLYLVFECKLSENSCPPELPETPDPDQTAVRWLSLTELDHIVLYPNIRDHIKDYYRNKRTIPFIEDHQLARYSATETIKMEERYIRNGEIKIHYTASNGSVSPELIPLLICPGLAESSTEYEEVIQEIQPRKCAAISFRGRPKSEAPSRGYGLQEHMSDIETVVQDLGWKEFVLLGYSIGCSYALGYALAHPENIKGLILIDYPAEHKKMPSGWAHSYLDSYENYFGTKAPIDPVAIEGIETESEQLEFWSEMSKLKIPVWVFQGMQQGSAMTEEHRLKYERIGGSVRIIEFEESGHDPRNTEYEKYMSSIKAFMDSLSLER